MGTVHTSRQLCGVSVLALLKDDIGAYPGRVGRPGWGASRPAANSGHAGHHHRASASSIMPSAPPGRLMRPF